MVALQSRLPGDGCGVSVVSWSPVDNHLPVYRCVYIVVSKLERDCDCICTRQMVLCRTVLYVQPFEEN